MHVPTLGALLSIALSASALGALADPPDIRAQLTEASSKISESVEKASDLLRDGKPDQATAALLGVFPESTRTPVQALVLANVLFQQEPRLSYTLHKFAAAQLPDHPNAQLEWAIEQHRAKEYDGAIFSYAKYSKAQPDHAVALGLAAECLIRTGKVREASDTWQKSEKATGGTLEDLESLVCEVHSGATPDRERALLMPKAAAGDIEAAEKLILLDCDWRRDWWNSGPHGEYLRHDLDLVVTAPIPASPRREALLAAGECWLARSRDADDSAEILKRRGFIVDPKATLPESGPVLSSVLAAALEGDAISRNDARAKLGDRILDQARKSKDAAAFNAAAHLYLGTPQLTDVDKLGWEATGDARFAVSYIVGKLASDEKLSLADPDLVKAIQQFPESAELAHVALVLAKREGKPLQPYLIAAIKAEYTHFSAGGPLTPRPSARPLRSYFGLLADELAKPAPAK